MTSWASEIISIRSVAGCPDLFNWEWEEALRLAHATIASDPLEIDTDDCHLYAAYGWLCIQAEKAECRRPTLEQAVVWLVRLEDEF